MTREDAFKTGKYYHLFNQGINNEEIFREEADYKRLMILLYLANSGESFRLDDILNKQKKIFDEVLVLDKGEPLISIGAWCLMPNGFNLLVRQEVDGGISKFMKKFCTGYSMHFNKKYKRAGALFDGLFKSEMIGSDEKYMEKTFSHIHLNLLKIKFPDWEEKIMESTEEMMELVESYPYSSYPDYIGKERRERNILAKQNFPDYFN